MTIADNILKAYLKNVFFVGGTACGGKTTISRKLAEKYGFALYDADAYYLQHRQIADSEHQPAMTRKFQSWEEYFNRSVAEYSAWLHQSMEEQLEMIFMDLIRLSQNQVVIADLNLSLETARAITDQNHIVFLITNPQLVAKDYYQRPDHRDLYDCIMSLANPQKALDTCSQTLIATTEPFYYAIQESEMFWIERDEHSTVEKTLTQVERHFQLQQFHR